MMEKLMNVSFIIMLVSLALLCISALFAALAQKNQDFNKLDISRKFMIAGMWVSIMELVIYLTAIILYLLQLCKKNDKKV